MNSHLRNENKLVFHISEDDSVIFLCYTLNTTRTGCTMEYLATRVCTATFDYIDASAIVFLIAGRRDIYK